MNPRLPLIFAAGFAAGVIVTVLYVLGTHGAVLPAEHALSASTGSAAPLPGNRLLRAPPPELAALKKPVASGGLVIVNASAEPPYDFQGEVGAGVIQRFTRRFDAEPVDPAWAPAAVDAFNLILAQLPERERMGDYTFACKESLCRLDMKGDPELLASPDPKKNIQGALLRALADPIANQWFDDSALFMAVDPASGLATLTIYAHRRRPG